jgi:hypothetical protein
MPSARWTRKGKPLKEKAKLASREAAEEEEQERQTTTMMMTQRPWSVAQRHEAR